MNATLGGQVDLTFFDFRSALPHARAGKLRALAVGGTNRNPQLPAVPAIAEVAGAGDIRDSIAQLRLPPITPPSGPIAAARPKR
jgi:tripartite-type tricarboxylate transporter receptor subunit TctC